MAAAKIMVTGTFSLRQHALEKSPLIFDTVIFDDASLINETDCLAALSHGANRAIFLGNRTLSQNMFLINPSSVNKTLFFRIKNAIQLEESPSTSNNTQPSISTSPQRRKSKQSAQTTPAKPLPPKITFVDSSESTEQVKKESFENYAEANQVADYLMAFKNELDFDNMAIMSPLRT